MVDYSSWRPTDLITLKAAAGVLAQISPERYAQVVDVVPKEKVPDYLLALLPQHMVPFRKWEGGGEGSLDDVMSGYKRATAATNRPLTKEFTELPVERLLALPKDGRESFDEYLQKIKDIVEVAGGLNIPEIALLVLLAQGSTEEEILSRFQSQRAKKPRDRKPSPYSAAAFVKAVRKESGKQKWNTAWNWLQVDQQFDGFDVIKLAAESVQYRYAGKDRKPITKDTFSRRWQGEK